MKFLFDLGGVFFDWSPEYFYQDIFDSKKEMEYFLKSVCNDEWNIKQDAGHSIIKAEKDLIKKFPNYERFIKLYYTNHRKMIRGVFQDSIEILSLLKNNEYSCFVLSNWSAETFKGIKNEFPFLNLFDGILISGEDKLIKPSKEIYELAISRFDLIPEETIFIDDKLENIKMAKKLCMKTIHLVNPKEIKKEIFKFIK